MRTAQGELERVSNKDVALYLSQSYIDHWSSYQYYL